MATEKLKFKLELYANFWDKPPIAEVLVNDNSFYNGTITGTEDKPQLIEFEFECTEGTEYSLIINRSGKVKGQTVVNENNNVLKDQLLKIKRIEIDEVELGALVYSGVYTPEYPEPWASQQRSAGTKLPETYTNVTNMGHNGTWTFKFSSPFYVWLLENLY